MKKLFFLIVAILCFVDVNAQTRTDSNGNTVYHHFFVVAEYQMRDFEFEKESGCMVLVWFILQFLIGVFSMSVQT